MRYWLLFVLFLFLTACKSTVPSQAITNNAIKELNGVTEVVNNIKNTTKEECKTSVLLANLESIKTQVDSVSGQIKNIELSCRTEKAVLEKEKTIRDILIVCLIAVLCFLLFFIVRVKR